MLFVNDTIIVMKQIINKIPSDYRIKIVHYLQFIIAFVVSFGIMYLLVQYMLERSLTNIVTI